MPAQRGFTYVALMVFLAIVALGSAMTLEVQSTVGQRDAEKELLAIGGEFNQAFASYYRQTPGGARRFPDRLEDLVEDPRFPGVKRHLRRLYADPLTGRKAWGPIPAPGGGIMGVFSLAEGTPMRTPSSMETPLAPVAAASTPMAGEVLPAGTGYGAWRFGYWPTEAGMRPTTRPVPPRASQ